MNNWELRYIVPAASWAPPSHVFYMPKAPGTSEDNVLTAIPRELWGAFQKMRRFMFVAPALRPYQPRAGSKETPTVLPPGAVPVMVKEYEFITRRRNMLLFRAANLKDPAIRMPSSMEVLQEIGRIPVSVHLAPIQEGSAHGFYKYRAQHLRNSRLTWEFWIEIVSGELGYESMVDEARERCVGHAYQHGWVIDWQQSSLAHSNQTAQEEF